MNNQIKDFPSESDHIVPSWVVRGNTFNWFRDLAMQDLNSTVDATNLGINNDISYQILEKNLETSIRFKLAKHRAFFLKGLLRFDEIQDYCKIIPPWGLETPVSRLLFTVRTSNRMIMLGVKSIGDLSFYSNETLMKVPGFGAKCLTEIKEKLSEQINEFLVNSFDKNSTSPHSEPSHTNNAEDIEDTVNNILVPSTLSPEIRDADNFLELIDALIKKLKKRQASILKMRLGMYEKDKTLQETGDFIGVSRERIRQLEASGRSRILAILDIRDLVRERLDRIREGMTIPLMVENLENYDTWFNGVKDKPWIIEAFFNIFGVGTYRVHKYDALSIVSLGEHGFIDELLKTTRAYLKKGLKDSVTRADVRNQISYFISASTPELIEFIFTESTKYARFVGEPPNDKLVSIGIGLDSLIKAILEESRESLHVQVIAEKIKEQSDHNYGINRIRSACSAVGLLFAPSTFGLRKHLELTDNEIVSVSELVIDLMQSGSKYKQWHSTEIMQEIPELISNFNIPIDQYKLGICLDISDVVNSLGRMVYSLKDESSNTTEKRIDFSQFVEAVLERSPTPLKTSDILSEITKDRGTSDFTQIIPIGRIVSTGISTWGLIDKHLGLIDNSFEKIVSEVVSILKNKSTGLTESELLNELSENSLAKKFANNPHIIFSLCTKAKLCKKEDDFLFLREWGEPRRITMRGAIAKVLSEMPENGLPIKDIVLKASFIYGKDLVRENVYGIIRNTGAFYDDVSGNWLYSNDLEGQS